MEIGTGVFLGAVFLGIVFLYGQTKDRWNWKKIALRAIAGFVFLLGGIALVLWGIDEYKARPTVQTEFLSIKLIDSPSDIKFKKGKPVVEDKDTWVFNDSSNDPEILIEFKDSALITILYIGNCSYCNRIGDLGIGASLEELKEKFGEPSSVSSSTDDLSRIVSFEKWNLVFELKSNKVTAFGIYNPKVGLLTFSNNN